MATITRSQQTEPESQNEPDQKKNGQACDGVDKESLEGIVTEITLIEETFHSDRKDAINIKVISELSSEADRGYEVFDSFLNAIDKHVEREARTEEEAQRLCTNDGSGTEWNAIDDEESATETEDGQRPCSFMACCPSPAELCQIKIILAYFAIKTKDLAAISTRCHDEIMPLFKACRECVDILEDQCEKIAKRSNRLSVALNEYLGNIQKTLDVRAYASEEERMKLIRLHVDLYSLSHVTDKMNKKVLTLREELFRVKEKVSSSENKSETLWLKGEPDNHRYYIDNKRRKIGRSILCIVRADRKTMRRHMLKCSLDPSREAKMNPVDDVAAGPIRFSSSEVLKKCRNPIVIIIPYYYDGNVTGREIVLLTRKSSEDPYEITSYKATNWQEMECVEFRVETLSHLMALVLSRPTMSEKTVGKQGGVFQCPNEVTVRIKVQPNALSGEHVLAIQSIPPTDIPLDRVQTYCHELQATSSIVYLKMPQEMKQSFQVELTINQKDRGSVKAAAYSNKSWKLTDSVKKKSHGEEYTVEVEPDTERVQLISTTEDENGTDARAIAENISEAIAEYVVNCIVMQNKDNPLHLYVDCCRKECTEGRLKEAESKRFVCSTTRKEVYINEGARIILKLSGGIQIDPSSGPDSDQLIFSAGLYRPNELFIKPSGSATKSFVHFVAVADDVGVSELKLRKFAGDKKKEIYLHSLPIYLKVLDK